MDVELTTKKLLYNMARIDYRYGRITEEELQKRKEEWEQEEKLK